MGILDIRPAKRGGSKAIIGIAGVSGSGKTYTALKIARGMVEKPSQIGFLDTENKRGSLYADILDGDFMIGDLYPPFSPKRYSEAIKEFQNAGVKVLVIDSVSHEWEGEGGCDDIANAALQNDKKMANWIGAKREHKSFMNTLLQCDMNIICCLRAREKTDFKNPNKPVSLGIQPVCEKNFMFEMTASLLMENEGKTQRFLKMPAFLFEAFGSGKGYLGEATGRKIIDWINTGEKEDPEITRIKSEMLMACEFGLAGVIAIWNALTPAMKKKLEAHKNICKEAALEYERQAEEGGETPQDTLKKNMKNEKIPELP
ncbi:AAA family ATPase [Flavihumibacter petaseus]|uniref:AAA+ ATPase domain-containing protein n=1 Tax=Flavihumibacter petaseus NBRC 106054 TaxID=1220578 RepID=A0A0E9N151_9BACT|nr:AAA family ATPase [Flavihumibacter petaseus]GAO43757.1 hypothetical protein FPE01S_02_08630 [Flavihumibacter petaseus NBRC 106054]